MDVFKKNESTGLGPAPNRVKSGLIGLILASVFPLLLSAQDGFTDPKPPQVHQIPADAKEPEAKTFDRLTFHKAPKPLSKDAVVSDWPRFLGPKDDSTSPETHLLKTIPESGLAPVWEVKKGTGYTSAIIAEGKLALFDRIDDEETIDCLDPATGKRFWHFGYPVVYQDRYGFKNGPRASAVINSGKVYTLGVTSILTCLDLKTGTLLWQRNLKTEFEVSSYFFGHGSCPLVYDGKVIVNLGGAGDLCVAAFDQHTGKLVWGTKHEWKSSYASPLVRTLQGKPRLLVFAGGESKPATGGLLCIDPATGKLFDAYPWRADKWESVNASNPVLAGENQIYISECYVNGGVLLKLTPELKWKEVWKAPEFGMHWMSPLVFGGDIYAFRGRNEPDAWLASYDIATGKENWRKDFQWGIKLPTGRDYQMKFFRGTLLRADGRNYCLGEMGSFAILDLNEKEAKITSQTQLFVARSTWSLPVLHKGLMYISQHEPDFFGQGEPRIICYDLRGEEKGTKE